MKKETEEKTEKSKDKMSRNEEREKNEDRRKR
jgi:hypothetical protein